MGTEKAATETISNITLVTPVSFLVVGGNLDFKVESQPTVRAHRKVVVLFEDDEGKQFLLPLDPDSARALAQRLEDEAVTAEHDDEEDLETMELDFSKAQED